MTPRKAVAATVTGRVQGVGYRYSVVDLAQRLGLTGWVRNAPDGSVETWAQGNALVLGQFLAFLEQGPRSARVDGVSVRSVAPDDSLTGFTVRS